MARKGLHFIMNKYDDDKRCLYTKMYRFIPEFGDLIKIIIEAEIYNNNITVISFYQHNKGTEKTKYKIRSRLLPGQVKAIFKACLNVYNNLGQDYALVFSATNNVNETKEYNDRYSAYLLFLSVYLKDFDDYDKKGSVKLNTHMIYHRSFQYKNEADSFFSDFESKVEESLNDNS